MKNTCKKNLVSDVFKLIDEVDVVSFDIFDTLLLRAFVHPFDVFGYLEYYFNVPDFKNLRLSAETSARLNYPEKEEVTLDEIYQFVPEKYRFIKEYEQKFELNILKTNKQMLDVFNYAKEKGKGIIIVSDMYLPKDTLKQALEKNGFIGYDKLFVSSDIGLRKSNGKMFEYIIKYLNISPDKILHIGDNITSDYNIPIKLGLKAFCYPYVADLFFSENNNLRFKKIYEKLKDNVFASLLIGMLIIKWHNKELNSYWEKIGYSLGGIFIYAYVKFIVDNISSTPATDCLFIARDGFTLSKVFSLFDEVKNIKNHYIFAPRFVRILGMNEGLENDSYFNYFKNAILEHFTEYKSLLSSENNPNVFLEKNDVKQYCSSILNEYKKYLNNVNLKGDKVYIVDLGSNSASSQKLLSTLLPEKILAGFYFALNKKANVPSFVYDDSKTPLIFEEFIEFLITEPCGPAVAFNDAKPIFKELEINDKKNNEAISSLQKGELSFCEDIKLILKGFEKSISSDFIKKYMNSFFEFSTQDDYEHLKNVFWYYSPDNKSCVSFFEVLKNKYNISKKSKFDFIKKFLGKKHEN